MASRGRIVAGVGINDADYEVSFNTPGRKVICPFYQTWADMIKRCYGAKAQDRNPSYQGCTVAPIWFLFSEFKGWMLQQSYEGKDLDKDILFPGNKIYSPDTCAFVSRNINIFVTDSGSRKGEWPIGVHRQTVGKKFVAQCRDPLTGKGQHLGCFSDPELAHEAWRARKHEHACAYADQQTDPRVAAALRNRYATISTIAGKEPGDENFAPLPIGEQACKAKQIDMLG